MILALWRLKQGCLDIKASVGYAGRRGKEVEGEGNNSMLWTGCKEHLGF